MIGDSPFPCDLRRVTIEFRCAFYDAYQIKPFRLAPWCVESLLRWLIISPEAMLAMLDSTCILRRNYVIAMSEGPQTRLANPLLVDSVAGHRGSCPWSRLGAPPSVSV
jgi:hypothetical protein